MTSLTIAAIDAALIRIPLRRPWGSDVLENYIITVDVTLSDGSQGHGFSWTPTIGPRAVLALVEDDIRSRAIGAPADPEVLWPLLWAQLHEAGSSGITSIALAGLDLALWDAKAAASGLSITDAVGATRESVAVYGSGVNLHYTTPELLEQFSRWQAAGHTSFKIKVGKPDLAEDIDRLAAVREQIGTDAQLMIDANQRWDLDIATRALDAFGQFDPFWIEEPLRADDLATYSELAKRTGIPIAAGENLRTIYQFEDAVDRGAIAIAQPNVIRVGGITPFLRIARSMSERGVTVHPHLLPELSGQLALCLPETSMVEDVEDASFEQLGALSSPSPIRIDNARLTTTAHTGLGMRFQEPREE